MKMTEMSYASNDTLILRVQGTPAELEDMVKRLVAGSLLTAAAVSAAPKPAAAPATPAPAAKPAVAAPAPAKPVAVAVAKPAVAAPVTAKPKAVAAPAPVAAEEPDPEDTPAAPAADTTGIPESILTAQRLREVITVLKDGGIEGKEQMLLWCQQNKEAVPALAKLTDLEERFERACVLLGITA